MELTPSAASIASSSQQRNNGHVGSYIESESKNNSKLRQAGSPLNEDHMQSNDSIMNPKIMAAEEEQQNAGSTANINVQEQYQADKPPLSSSRQAVISLPDL